MKKLAILAVAAAAFAALPGAASAHPHFVPVPRFAPHFHGSGFHAPFFHAHAPFFGARAFFPVPVPVPGPAYYAPAPVYGAPYAPPAYYGYGAAPVFPVPPLPSVSFHVPGVSVRFGF
jgi:hypothetical protein